MRLETLQHHDDRTAKAILAAAALSHSNAPYKFEKAGIYRKEVRDLIDEVERKLHVTEDDSDYDLKIRNFLSEQVVAAIMGDANIDEVRESLGARGDLPISSYKLKFDHNAFKNSRENEKFIRKIIENATDVQHVPYEGKVPSGHNPKGMTLIVSEQKTKGAFDHWILIDAMTMKDELFISDVFRVFPEIVDLSTVSTPLDMLRAFVNHYGVEFLIDNVGPAKMFEQLSFRKSEQDLAFSILEKYERTLTSITGSTVEFAKKETSELLAEKVCFIVAAYTIDFGRYMKDRSRLSQF